MFIIYFLLHFLFTEFAEFAKNPTHLCSRLATLRKHSLNALVSGKISDKCQALIEKAGQGKAFTAPPLLGLLGLGSAQGEGGSARSYCL